MRRAHCGKFLAENVVEQPPLQTVFKIAVDEFLQIADHSMENQLHKYKRDNPDDGLNKLGFILGHSAVHDRSKPKGIEHPHSS